MSQNSYYLEGPLSKWTNLVNGWQYRWFVLNYQTGILSYYTSREKMKRGSRRGCVYLQKAMIGIDDEDDSGFSITSDFKQFHFQARDTEDREKWVRALEYAIYHQRHQRIGTSPHEGEEGTEATATVPNTDDPLHRSDSRGLLSLDQASSNVSLSSAHARFGVGSGFDSTLDVTGQKEAFHALPKNFDFDAKIAEADAYLQILINQLRHLEQTIGQMKEEDEMHKKYLEIKVSTNALIDSVKHSIVILQITRNALFPSTGIYQSTLPPLILKSEPPTGLEPVDFGTDVLLDGLPVAAIAPVSRYPADDASSPYQLTPPSETGSVSPSPLVGMKHQSFSSSEEEFFFDAQDEKLVSMAKGHRLTPYFSPEAVMGISSGLDKDRRRDSTQGSLKKKTEGGVVTGDDRAEAVSSDKLNATKNPNDNKGNPGDVRLSASDQGDSAFQNDSSEEELEDISDYGGLIKHLVSQVRIGMDLTKVTLPTFILERRSLLEMFADFFAHATLFSRITDLPTPKERMTEIVRYYLSSFHTGRKSSVAKKPFNPILGETFKCYWDTQGTDTEEPSTSGGGNRSEPPPGPAQSQKEVIAGSPCVAAGVGNLTFVAEQVSHHPPVSAFYAENIAKKVCLNANIWTKSKFLGLSIGVHMIGQGVINLLEHGEEYVCTFPNAYARSIFSIPWIEMGGKVTITCSKTGYFANIEFLTKPFYGGSKNQVSAQIFSPFEKNPYLSITGEWNGTMIARTSSSDETFEFLDTKTIPTQSKQVRPISQQDAFESRRIWIDVAKALKSKELDRATEHKHDIEERQRNEARQRSESGRKWECKFFDEINGNWVYKRPLYKRLAS